MARELGPGGILPPGANVDDGTAHLNPDAVADAYWNLVEQDRSAWTLELDLRPHLEEF